MPENTINRDQFLTKLKTFDSVEVKFRKKDGSIRKMQCTLNFEKIPKEYHPKSDGEGGVEKRNKYPNQITVFDLVKKGWRIVTFDKLEWVNDGIRRYNNISLK